MIHHALSLLRLELDNYIKSLPGHGATNYVVLGNVATLESETGSSSTDLDNSVILTLVNIEEESAFKNMPNYTKVNGGVRYANPPVCLNLYLLFSANFPPGNYQTALEHLSEVIQFFQGRNAFNLKNAPDFLNNNEPPPSDIAEMQLFIDLYTMTFEQINHLWGSLGGKQMPFAMYKARLVKVMDRRTTGIGPVIEEVGNTGKAL